MSDVTLDGEAIHSESDLHEALEAQLEFGDHYGRNLAALRDRLLTDVPRPTRLIWHHSDVSRDRLGANLFSRVVAIFEEAARQDVNFGWVDRFEFELASRRGSIAGGPG
jgi:ribonuclease inhibitor